MADINVCTMTGRLTRDAEIKYTQGGFPIVGFALATNQRKKNGEQWDDVAHFFDCKMLGKRGEGVARFLTKGKQVAINGTLQQSRWEKDGQKHSRIEILVNDLQLIGSKGNAQADAPEYHTGNDEDVPF
jgi:single-strand DNA-binding protein